MGICEVAGVSGELPTGPELKGGTPRVMGLGFGLLVDEAADMVEVAADEKDGEMLVIVFLLIPAD